MGYSEILKKIKQAQNLLKTKQKITLVAVSKKKSIDDIMKVYDMGLRDFGENYVDEFLEKQDKLPKDIRWHFIGHLQSNKVNKLLNSNIFMLHTVDTPKLAMKLNNKLIEFKKSLDIMIQVKMSEEKTKFGCDVQNLPGLVDLIQDKCKFLNLVGLMMIGEYGKIEQFEELRKIRDSLDSKLELSMGMSADFEKAIQEGSNYVRIGSAIFGPRV